MKFSERYGYTQARTVAQVESMDDPLRTALWNVTYQRFFVDYDAYEYRQGHSVIRVLWAVHLHRDLATAPDDPFRAADQLRAIFAHGEWFEVYDLIQAIVEAISEQSLIQQYNAMMEVHLAGYRIVGKEVTALTGKDEVEAVTSATTESSRFAGVQHALKTALALYSRRENPDYANSIKESISAVESMVKELTGRAPLGAGIDELARLHPNLHRALIAGWKSLYGFTSNADAIRHGGLTGPNVTQADARYFLVTCSAFVNLLITLA